jgi:hypothetical protein
MCVGRKSELTRHEIPFFFHIRTVKKVDKVLKVMSISSSVSFGMANKIDRVAAGNFIILRK